VSTLLRLSNWPGLVLLAWAASRRRSQSCAMRTLQIGVFLCYNDDSFCSLSFEYVLVHCYNLYQLSVSTQRGGL
jgi:hypothetical protein